MANKNTEYINVARKIINSYLDTQGAISEIVLLFTEEFENKYTYLKEHINAIKNVMDKALKEIEKLESKDERVL